MYWLPPSYNPAKPNPLILSFHGGGVNSDRQTDQDFFADASFNMDHVVVYPQGLLVVGCSVAPPTTVWQGVRVLPRYWDDVVFVLALLDFLERELLCLDPARVYAAGKSMGGGAINGLDCVPPVQRWVEEWAVRDGLDPSSPAVEKLPSGDNATVYRYGKDGGSSGKEGKEEGLVTFVMAGDHVNHDWPTTVDYGSTSRVLEPGQGPANFNGTSMMMDFFRKYKTPD
ncbi:hypothetical protein PG994_011611 [Apiospora phragmitis]|uniref:feruloyl esterase n=1 Tax=Apiospora phragmitis TaxID=2905665 RepID=A0ABR1TVG9_9PEZI